MNAETQNRNPVPDNCEIPPIPGHNTPNIDDYMENATGHLVLTSTISEIDLMRNNMINDLRQKALKVSQEIANFKADAEGDIEAFMQLSAEQYGVKWGGKKGNVALRNYNGSAQVKIQKQDIQAFNERLQVAKELIDEIIIEKSEGIDEVIKALMLNVFNTTKEGKVNKTELQRLKDMKTLNHPKWPMVLKALNDSINIIGTREYINFYERDEHGKMQLIVLNIAGL